jgi:hypothetical protein
MSDGKDPTWRYLLVGMLLAGFAGYLLLAGEMALDKRQTAFITRADDPLVYWLTVLVSGTLGTLSLAKVWRRVTRA